MSDELKPNTNEEETPEQVQPETEITEVAEPAPEKKAVPAAQASTKAATPEKKGSDKKAPRRGLRGKLERFPRWVSKQVSTYRGEIGKITWPNFQETRRKTFTVVVICLLFGAYIGLLDLIFGAALSNFVNFLLW